MNFQFFEDRINGLKKARDVCSSQLDTGALKELDDSFSFLDELRIHPQNTKEAETRKLRVLQAIAAFVHIVTNLSDWS